MDSKSLAKEATILFGKGEFEAAANVFKKSVGLCENQEEKLSILVNLGTSLERAGRLNEALSTFESLVAQSEESKVGANIHNNIGVVYKQLGDIEKSVHHFRRSLELDPAFVDAHFNLGNYYWSIESFDNAMICFQHTISLDPVHVAAQRMIDAIEGNHGSVVCPEYVADLFDSYASHFEESITHLGYKTPEQFGAVFRKLSFHQAPEKLLDLGCGTGLVGQVFSSLVPQMVGVDLSQQMLYRAVTKGLYQDLYHCEALAFLKESEDDYDVIIAADMIIYVKELIEFFELVFERLKPDGVFLFSSESSESRDFEIMKSGRIAHSPSYIISELRAAGFSLEIQESVVIRTEKEQPVYGGHFVARKKKARTE